MCLGFKQKAVHCTIILQRRDNAFTHLRSNNADTVVFSAAYIADDFFPSFGVTMRTAQICINASTITRQKLAELSKKTETLSFGIIEADYSYTRAGYELEVEGVKYEGSAHSIKNGIHYVTLDLKKC